MAINPRIKQKAEDIRTKVFGSEVRESLASGLEGMSEDVESIKGRQGNVESQFQNVIEETTGKDVISAPEIIAARGGHDNLSQRLLSTDQQLQQNTNTNPEFRNNNEDTLSVSEELITNATVNLGEGWSGNIQDGFAHSEGFTEPLVFTLPLSAGGTYNVELEITNPAVVDDGQSDYWISLGGSPEFETYRGRSNRMIWGIKAVSGNQIVVRPWEGYGGVIKFSVKRVLGVLKPYAGFKDINNLMATEFRVSGAEKNSLYIGRNSGRYAGEAAEENTVFGNEAGQSITSGFWNVLLGFGAGREGTTATRNVMIGRFAGRDNVTGNRIVAIGSWALLRNISGENLTAIGADAMYYNVDGSDKIGIGTVAIGGNPSGRYLIGIGDRVMANSEGGEHVFAAGRLTLNYNKGSHNVAIGEQAGYQNREGSHNFYAGNRAGMLNKSSDNIVAIGNEALFNNLEHSNIGIGNRAQYHNVNGKYNISFGHQASYENVEGNYNISAGFQALYANKQDENIAFGFYSGQYLDGSSNLALGTNALKHLTGSRNIGIGRGAGSRVDAIGNSNLFIGISAGSNHLSGDNNILIGSEVNKTLANASNELNIGNVIRSRDMTTGIVELQKLKLTSLPTVEPSESDMLWNDGGTLKISA